MQMTNRVQNLHPELTVIPGLMVSVCDGHLCPAAVDFVQKHLHEAIEDSLRDSPISDGQSPEEWMKQGIRKGFESVETQLLELARYRFRRRNKSN